MEALVITGLLLDGWNFTRVARASMRLRSKPLKLILHVAPGEYHASSASHSPVWFITFMYLAKKKQKNKTKKKTTDLLNCASCY